MRVATFQALRQQFGFRCGYCAIHEADAGTTLTTDHFQPRSQSGSDDFANLVYSCHACNEHKGNYWNPGDVMRLLHPLQDDLAAHIAGGSNGVLNALSATGAFHIARLQLNRPALVAHRQLVRERTRDRVERSATLTTLGEMLSAIQRLETAIENLRTSTG